MGLTTKRVVLLFFSLLALGAQLAVVALAAAAASPAGRRFVAREVAPFALVLAAGVAAVAMAGSLYLSEVEHFIPCKLCWYQRMAMYPLAVTLVAAAVRRDRAIRPFALLLAGLGAPISIYHMLIERFPRLEGGACDVGTPCNVIWTERLGYLTIPTMALSGFALIIGLLLVEPLADRHGADHREGPHVEPSP